MKYLFMNKNNPVTDINTNNRINHNYYKSFILSFWCFLCFYPSYFVFATSTNNYLGKDLSSIIVSLAYIAPTALNFISSFCVIIGIVSILLALFKLKHLADFRNMMSGQTEVGKSLTLIIVGIIFIWLPFFLEAITYTMFGQNIEQLQSAYPVRATGTRGSYYLAAFRILQVVGFISFVRGLFMLGSMSKGQQQPGTFGKAMTHIVAGVMLVNFTAFIGIMETTLGLKFTDFFS